MYKYIALALLVATTDAMKLYSRHGIAKPHVKSSLAQLMQPTAEEIMSVFDGNANGEIDEEEFRAAIEELSGDAVPEDIMEEYLEDFHEADSDDNGTVNMTELTAAMNSH
tara:strand:+ start:199 stop:528 length:330 start_codon:yes stop_codon:yes gene_type:complete